MTVYVCSTIRNGHGSPIDVEISMISRNAVVVKLGIKVQARYRRDKRNSR